MSSNGFGNGLGAGDTSSAPKQHPLKKAPPPPTQTQLVEISAQNLDILPEFSFKNLHEMIGKPILDGMAKRKEEQARKEQPLIEF